VLDCIGKRLTELNNKVDNTQPSVNCSISSDGTSLFEGRCAIQQLDAKGSFNISGENKDIPLNDSHGERHSQ
jgi:hypothetical protein